MIEARNGLLCTRRKRLLAVRPWLLPVLPSFRHRVFHEEFPAEEGDGEPYADDDEGTCYLYPSEFYPSPRGHLVTPYKEKF